MSDSESKEKNMKILEELATDGSLVERAKSISFWLMTRHSELKIPMLVEMAIIKLNKLLNSKPIIALLTSMEAASPEQLANQFLYTSIALPDSPIPATLNRLLSLPLHLSLL